MGKQAPWGSRHHGEAGSSAPATGCHNITPDGPRIGHRRKSFSACDPDHSAVTLMPAWWAPKKQEVPMRVYIEVVLTIIGLLGAYVALLPLIT